MGIKDFGSFLTDAGNAAKDLLDKSKEKVVQAIDQNGDGDLDLTDVSMIAKSVGDTVKRIVPSSKDEKNDDNDNDANGKKDEKKEELIFKSLESMQQVVNVVNEAAEATKDKTRTISKSSIPEVLTGTLGAGIGGIGSFAALYGLGSVGLSAAGITSGLATAGGLIGGGMVAGVFVLAAPVAILAAGGVGLASALKKKQLEEEKTRLYEEAVKKHEAIIQAMKQETDANKERLDYLQSLNILLTQAIKDLKKDLGTSVG